MRFTDDSIVIQKKNILQYIFKILQYFKFNEIVMCYGDGLQNSFYKYGVIIIIRLLGHPENFNYIRIYSGKLFIVYLNDVTLFQT